MALGKAITEANLKKFHAQIGSFSALLMPEQQVLFQQKIVLQVLNGVVFKTPVDTGRARGGWQVSLDVPDIRPSVILDSDGGRAPATPSNSNTIVRGLNILNGLRPLSVVYINNNVEYILFLEEGRSPQAPRGMIALTLEEVRQQFV